MQTMAAQGSLCIFQSVRLHAGEQYHVLLQRLQRRSAAPEEVAVREQLAQA
jgi:hypothetical protein